MILNRNNLKLLVKEVMHEARSIPDYVSDEEKQDKELTWKKITDNLEDEGFRLLTLKAIKNANSADPEFLADLFETLINEDDREVQEIIIRHIEKIYKEEDS